MTKRFLTDDGKRALTNAIREVESRSSAEVVIAVRPLSGSYLHADLLAASVAAVVTLAFLLFSPWPFGLLWILIDPIIVGGLVALLSSRFALLRRSFTRRWARRQQVEAAARTVFVEKDIHETRDRTGILIYLSLLERLVVVLIDVGVQDAVPQQEWADAVARISAIVTAGGDASQVATGIEELASILELALIRDEDDINELPDEVCG